MKLRESSVEYWAKNALSVVSREELLEILAAVREALNPDNHSRDEGAYGLYSGHLEAISQSANDIFNFVASVSETELSELSELAPEIIAPLLDLADELRNADYAEAAVGSAIIYLDEIPNIEDFEYEIYDAVYDELQELDNRLRENANKLYEALEKLRDSLEKGDLEEAGDLAKEIENIAYVHMQLNDLEEIDKEARRKLIEIVEELEQYIASFEPSEE